MWNLKSECEIWNLNVKSEIWMWNLNIRRKSNECESEFECLTKVLSYPKLNMWMSNFVSVMSLGWMCNECQIMPESKCAFLSNVKSRI